MPLEPHEISGMVIDVLRRVTHLEERIRAGIEPDINRLRENLASLETEMGEIHDILEEGDDEPN